LGVYSEEIDMCGDVNNSGRSRSRLCLLAASSFSLILAISPTMVGAATAGTAILRIEEDWEIVLTDPVDDLQVPQFHTVMSPYAGQDSTYFQVSWNYRDEPDFQAGGLQLQVWSGEDHYASRDVDAGGLSSSAETVSWTQSLALDSNHLTFAVSNGHSSSWGDFGGESMTVRLNRAMHSLDNYSTDISAAGSWVTYGTNRVVRLQISAVRIYDENGLLSQSNSPRVIYQYEGGD
jgi:hypothetical protein